MEGRKSRSEKGQTDTGDLGEMEEKYLKINEIWSMEKIRQERWYHNEKKKNNKKNVRKRLR